MKQIYLLAAWFLSMVLLSGTAFAAKKKVAPKPESSLTDKGKTLEAKYADRLKVLKKDIIAALPKPDASKFSAFLKDAEAEKAPGNLAYQTARKVKQYKKRDGMVLYKQQRLEYLPKVIADAKAKLEKAKALPDSDPTKAEKLEKLEKTLAGRQKELDKLPKEIEKAVELEKSATKELPEAIKKAEAAKAAYLNAQKATWKAMDALGVSDLLGSDALDGKLAEYMVIIDATPRGLAEFAQQSPENEKLVGQLMNNKDLMIQMLVADGPSKAKGRGATAKFGKAMKIYTNIQKASPKAKDGILQRLALAVSLAHAVPVEIRGPEAKKETVEYVDPVKRYLNYEKWYLDGELDQGFKDLSVWNLAMVVGGNDPDEVYAWGRKMLHNLRPDCIPKNGDTKVYCDVVIKEIAYTTQNLKYDDPELNFKQNILANGGICGRQAFFARMILRAFGVPTTARKQPGHATLAHWHPDGWKTRLGGNWGPGARGKYSSMNRTRSRPYGVDLNFQASSQAREDEAGFMRVKRAQWIGAVVGEKPMPGLITPAAKGSKNSKKGKKPTKTKRPAVEEKPGVWSFLALHEQKRIITGLEAKAGKGTKVAPVTAKAPVATGKASVDSNGVITIPSAACSNPTESTKATFRNHGHRDLVVFLKNASGDTVLNLSRFALENDSFEYTFDAPKAGKYKLTAEVVTPQPKQRLMVSANGGADVEMPLPYTIGMWDKAKPVDIQLKNGKNVLKFHGPSRVTIKEFKLTPAE